VPLKPVFALTVRCMEAEFKRSRWSKAWIWRNCQHPQQKLVQQLKD